MFKLMYFPYPLSVFPCNSSGSLFEPPAAAGEERKRGHPAPRQGDCVPLHPLLSSYHVYPVVRYCTLNNVRESVHTRSTVKPAVAASCANSSSVYLYELSVQMLSPSLKEISLPPMRTVWFFRLTRCISMRL